MTEIPLDISYKLRLRRLFWSMGYFSPLEVKLAAYAFKFGEQKRYDISDIDVMGIRFEKDLQQNIIIGDCKSGSESSINRIFWLKGVMDFFEAARGYFVQPTISDHTKQVASKLNINLLTADNFALIENEMGIGALKLFLFDIETYKRAESLWGLDIKKGDKPTNNQLALKEIYSYLDYTFWIVEDYRNIFTIIDRATDLQRFYQEFQEEKISLLQMGGFILSTDRKNFVYQAREYMFGGMIELRERELLFRKISELVKQKLTVEPTYYNELLELVNRLVKFAIYSKDIPRYLEIVLYEYVLNDSQLTFDNIFKDYSVDTLKLTKDIAVFLCNVSGIDRKFFDKLLTL